MGTIVRIHQAHSDKNSLKKKLLEQGRRCLSDLELLTLLIGSGTKKQTALSIAQQVLEAVSFDLDRLGRMRSQELLRQEGIGEARAMAIVSALELGRRRMCNPPKRQMKISCASHAYELMKPVMLDLPHEEFWVLILNRANHVLQRERVSSGGVSGTIADPKIIFKKALDCLASAVILIHNHPSGNRQPSEADIVLTKKLKQGGELLEIAVLDHLIFTDRAYFSFNEEGLL